MGWPIQIFLDALCDMAMGRVLFFMLKQVGREELIDWGEAISAKMQPTLAMGYPDMLALPLKDGMNLKGRLEFTKTAFEDTALQRLTPEERIVLASAWYGDFLEYDSMWYYIPGGGLTKGGATAAKVAWGAFAGTIAAQFVDAMKSPVMTEFDRIAGISPYHPGVEVPWYTEVYDGLKSRLQANKPTVSVVVQLIEWQLARRPFYENLCNWFITMPKAHLTDNLFTFPDFISRVLWDEEFPRELGSIYGTQQGVTGSPPP